MQGLRNLPIRSNEVCRPWQPWIAKLWIAKPVGKGSCQSQGPRWYCFNSFLELPGVPAQKNKSTNVYRTDIPQVCQQSVSSAAWTHLDQEHFLWLGILWLFVFGFLFACVLQCCLSVLSFHVFSIFELNILCWLMLAGNFIQQLLTEHGEKEASESSQLCSWKHCELHLPTWWTASMTHKRPAQSTSLSPVQAAGSVLVWTKLARTGL